ncbi:regulatory protein, luxR family [Pseudonocardia ammonioxydans]|uniref:Regulatory protein, luxR family n=1 Tax=Pseudonocardia ammonioxydans TaxID=260086 RepID=A0A1I4UJI2_PSUAM|nr:helix-turn-helix transcriptional regulator [Pseudonocardia ammonioxydans]SFM89055.1 regulatory protein, luxR family [Pseudonocardia ammonioxydans]
MDGDGSPMVGRTSERARISSALRAARDGRGALLLVTGEPGIGKSMLATTVAADARDAGADVVWGRCRETPGAPAFQPWTEIVRYLGRGAPAADLGPLLAGRAATVDRFALFEAVTELLVRRGRPLLVLLEDLHRADEASLLLLDHLLPVLDDAPVVVLGTCRDGGTEWPPGLDPVAGRSTVGVLRLGGLSAPEARELAGRLAAGTADPDALRARCGGNPYFMSELLRGPTDGDLPVTVAAALAARVGRLPPRTRAALEAAAVLGREFVASDVAGLLAVARIAVAQIDNAQIDGARIDHAERASDVAGSAAAEAAAALSAAGVERALAPAVADRLLTTTGRGHAFAHVLVRDVLHAACPADRRTVLHHGAAGMTDLPVSERAEHAGRVQRTAAERERAARLAVEAATEAAGRLAFEEEHTWLGRALEHTAPGDRFGLLLASGAAAGRAGRGDAARTAHDQAWLLAGDRPGRRPAAVALGLGEVVDSAGIVDAGLVRMLERALDLLPPAERATRVALLARLAVEIYWGPRLPEARAVARDAVAAARRLGDARTLTGALAAQQFVLRGPADRAERVRTGRELVRHAAGLGDVPAEVSARRLLVADAFADSPEALETELGALEALAEQTRRPLARWYAMVFRTALTCLRDPAGDALEAIARTETFGRRIGARPAGMYATVQRFAVLRGTGRVAEAEPALRAAITAYPRLATLRCGLTLLLAGTGREREATASLEALTDDDCAAVPRDALWLSSMVQLAEAAAALGHREAAATLSAALRPHRGEVVLQGLVAWLGAVDHHLGLLAGVLGRDAEAGALLAAGARTHREWSASALPVRRAPAARAVTLTRRERQVLDLVTTGSPNKQIARLLGISVHTVERHLVNGYAKLGARNRAEATAQVLRGR